MRLATAAENFERMVASIRPMLATISRQLAAESDAHRRDVVAVARGRSDDDRADDERGPGGVEDGGQGPQVLGFVQKLRTYAYDAYMLACAQQIGTPLITLDDALKIHAETVGIHVLEI